MRSHLRRTLVVLAGGTLLAGAGWCFATRANAAPDAESRAALTHGFQKGSPDYKAIGPLAFSPSGVLFFADDQAGAVYGVDLNEKPSSAKACGQLADLGGALAGRLGTTTKGIEIKDVAVSPVSHDVYLSVRKTDGADQNPANPANYALFCVDPAGKVSAVDLTTKPFGKVAVAGNPGYRTGPMAPARVISDIAYAKGRILATALSTEQFNSNLVSIPVPFNSAGVEKYATSIYHVSHHRQETASPIQTLTVYRDGDREYLMAAYICTPVVRFNLEDLKPGQVATGTTVAELGSGNRPMNMVAYGQPGSQSLLLNNSVFGIVKVDGAIAKETAAVNQMTKANRGDGGKTPYAGIQPLDGMKDVRAYAPAGNQLVVVRATTDNLSLEAVALP